MPAALKVTKGYLKDRVLLVPFDGPFLVGSSLEANLTLYGPQVDDRHAVLVPEGEVHRLVPVGKRATRVGGRRIGEARLLEDGDRIVIGRHEFVYARSSRRPEIAAGAGSPSATQACATCGEPLGPLVDATPSLRALAIGAEVVCPRCVDLRLHVDKDLESYRILRKIGSNEEEVTYLAVDRATNARVAIRILKADRQADPTVLRRFVVRAMVGLVLDHPNFLEVQAVRSSRGITYVVLDHLEHGQKLERYVREKAPVPAEEALVVTNQLAEILRHARSRRIVVAKRKKSGVLVDRRQRWVKVLAFDLTRELEEEVSRTAAFAELVERSGHDPAALMAAGFPEPADEDEARLQRLADEYAEAYSVGRILYQLLVGKTFAPPAVKAVRLAWLRRTGKAPAAGATGPADALDTPVLQLLDRALFPKGPEHLRTLQDFARASKVAFQALREAGRPNPQTPAKPS